MKYIFLLTIMSTQLLNAEERHNRVKVLAGTGITGVSTERVGNTVNLKLARGLVYGIGYDVPIGTRLTIGAEMSSNGNALACIGFDL